MTTAQYPNRGLLWEGLAVYRDEMSEFVARVLRQKPGSRLEQTVAGSLTDQQRQGFDDKMRQNNGDVAQSIEIGFIPNLVERNWADLFQRGRFANPTTIRNRLRIIRDIRNELSHNISGPDLAAEKARANLYFISETLDNINRPEQARQVMALLSRIGDPGTAQTPPDPAPAPAPPPPARGGQQLKPWRDAMHPKGDVADGAFLEADFVADLYSVFDGTAPAMYGDPLEFFRCTYVTSGIRDLLVSALRRVNGKGGNPIIQTKTGFGGGKTHSLIALYHLVKSADELLETKYAAQNAGIRDEIARIRGEIAGIMAAAGVDPGERAPAQVCVLHGAWLSPTGASVTDAGDPRNTLWGEMAWQLGGQPGYETVGAAARQGTAPGGEELDRLFRLTGPCIILMDEIVSYARNADIDTIATFFQNLTEAVNRRDNVALIVTLPVTATEAGGERGVYAMSVLENILSRMQAVTQVAQASNDEAFAVVRRRLFQEDCDEAAKEAVCQAFYRIYQRGGGDYPPEARETRYLDRLRQCYPIHPEIFDRLYDDWSLYHQFQRTRGVLRMMAQTIRWLCANNDQSLLIMPGNLPFSEGSISEEFLRLLGPQWSAVMGEVDGDNSRTHVIDRQKPERFGSVGGAARRVARAAFLGSSTQKAVRGLTARQINLAVAAPGHGVAAYAEALQIMDGELYHFYRGNDHRYYFDSDENLNKVANDRAAELGSEELDAEIVRRLSEYTRRDHNRAVIACPPSPAEVRDDDFARLIILPPAQSKNSRAAERDYASEAAKAMLAVCAPDVRRTRPNTLLFLSASSDGVREMRAAARRFLAWDSMINGSRRVAGLTGDRLAQCRGQLKEADDLLHNALSNAYRWAMAPAQPDPQKAEYDTTGWRQIGAAQPDIADNALQRFLADELLVDALSPAALARRLQESIWNGANPRYHLTVDELWDLLTRNIHLGLRLRHREVLEQCLAAALQSGALARADGYDAGTGEYRNLSRSIGESPRPYLTGATLLVEPDLAQLLLDESRAAAAGDDGAAPAADPGPGRGARAGAPAPPPPAEPHPPRPRRIIARKTVARQEAVSYDFNTTIRDEIARVMANAGCAVTVEVIVTGNHDAGISENAVRSLRLNSDMLGITLDDSTADGPAAG